MILEKNNINKLVLYFFYDKNGIIDDYIIYFLQSIKKCSKDILFISNGKIEEKSLSKLDEIPSLKVIERENKGFDVWAYKEGLNSIGFDNIESYDEIIMTNFTIMGPVYPFNEMFERMNERDLDFWGITVHNGAEINPYSKDPELELNMPAHLQSHFITVRKSLFLSNEFKEYWDNMPPITKYEEAVNNHEVKFTTHFSDLGYKFDAYIDIDKYYKISSYPLMYQTIGLIKNDRCPIFKRKAFFLDVDSILCETDSSFKYLIEYLDKHTEFNTDFIWQNILRSANLGDMFQSMNLNFEVCENPCDDLSSLSYLIIINIRDLNDIDLVKESLNNIKRYKNILISANLKVYETVKNEFKGFNVVSNNNMSQPLLPLAKEINKYEYICLCDIAHHKFVDKMSVCSTFNKNSVLSLIKSDIYIDNVLKHLKDNKRLGILTPLKNLHSMYFSSIGNDWQSTFDSVKYYLDKIGCIVPISKKIPPVSLQSGSFWFKKDAIKNYLDFDFNDFTLNKNYKPKFSNFIKFVDNLLPFIAQGNGFYTESIFPKEISETQIRDLTYFLSSNNIYLKETYSNVFYIKSYLYFLKDGQYRERNKMEFKSIYNKKKDNSIEIEFKFPFDCEEFRFDIVEYAGCILRGTRVYKNDKDINLDVNLSGGYSIDDLDFFFSNDPFYVFKGNFNKDEKLKIVVPYFALIDCKREGLIDMNRNIVPKIHELKEKIDILEGKRGFKNKASFLIKSFFK